MNFRAPENTNKKKSIIHYVRVSHEGNQSIDPVDILRSKEGYEAFVRDRNAISTPTSIKPNPHRK